MVVIYINADTDGFWGAGLAGRKIKYDAFPVILTYILCVIYTIWSSASRYMYGVKSRRHYHSLKRHIPTLGDVFASICGKQYVASICARQLTYIYFPSVFGYILSRASVHSCVRIYLCDVLYEPDVEVSLDGVGFSCEIFFAECGDEYCSLRR